MPRYRILLEGSNIAVSGGIVGDPSQTIRGFFVTRLVEASDPSEAASRATAGVAAEWSSGAYSHLGVVPTLAVSKVHAMGFFERLRARNTGYVFHPGS